MPHGSAGFPCLAAPLGGSPLSLPPCSAFGTRPWWWLGVIARALTLPRRSRSKCPFAHERGPCRACGHGFPINCTVALTAALRRGASSLGNVALQPVALMKNKFDFPAIKTAFRTAGALMIGNSFVAPLIFENRNWLGILALSVFGFCFIIVTSFKGD